MRILAFYIGLVFLSLSACKKPEERKCFKTAGSETTLEIPMDDFGRLELGPKINFVLVQDSMNKIVIKGGEHLISMIGLDIVDGDLLRIENRNKCNFLRSYKKEVTVEVHFKAVYNIVFKGTRDLVCTNAIKSPYFTFLTLEASGTCKLNIDSKTFHLVCDSWGNFELEGKTGYLKIDMRGNSFGDARNIQVNDSLNIVSNSAERTQIRAHNIPLRAEVSSRGDIWYVGNPSSIEYNRYGSGALVNKN